MRNSDFFQKRVQPPESKSRVLYEQDEADPQLLTAPKMADHLNISINRTGHFKRVYEAAQLAYERAEKGLKADGKPMPPLLTVMVDDLPIRCGYIKTKLEVFAIHKDDAESLKTLREKRLHAHYRERKELHHSLIEGARGSGQARREGRD